MCIWVEEKGKESIGGHMLALKRSWIRWGRCKIVGGYKVNGLGFGFESNDLKAQKPHYSPKTKNKIGNETNDHII